MLAYTGCMIEMLENRFPRRELLAEAKENLAFANENGGTECSYEELARLMQAHIGVAWDKGYVRRFITSAEDNAASGARLTAAQVGEMHILSQSVREKVEEDLRLGLQRPLMLQFSGAVRNLHVDVVVSARQMDLINTDSKLAAALRRAVENAVTDGLKAYGLGQQSATPAGRKPR